MNLSKATAKQVKEFKKLTDEIMEDYSMSDTRGHLHSVEGSMESLPKETYDILEAFFIVQLGKIERFLEKAIKEVANDICLDGVSGEKLYKRLNK